MNTLNQTALDEFLTKAAIEAAAPERHIGRELIYRPPARRTIVVHFGPNDSAVYVSAVVSLLLASQESWLLVGRYGPASQLGDLTTDAGAEALVFDATERERLCRYVCARDMRMSSASQDIYLVSADGNVLVTWDHHTEDEGLGIDMRDVRQSNALLTDLNRFGAELEIFYTDG